MPPALAAVDDAPSWPAVGRAGPAERPRVTLRQDAQLVEGVAEDGQEPAEPVVHPRSAQAEEFGHEYLQRVGLEVDQEEQQLLPRFVERPGAAPAGAALAGAARRRAVHGVQALAAAREN